MANWSVGVPKQLTDRLPTLISGGHSPVVSVVRLHGVIASGAAGLGRQLLNADSVEGALKRAFTADGVQAVALAINSPGGSFTSLMAIYDTMQYVRADISTVCLGQAASAAAVLLAAGSGTRLGGHIEQRPVNKVLLPVAGVPILTRSVRTVLEVTGVHRIILVVRDEDRDAVREAVAPHLGSHDLWVIEGGAHRHQSEWQALRTLAVEIEEGEIDVVAIHDAARPLAPASLWRSVIDAALAHGAAIPTQQIPRLSRRDGSLAEPGLVAVQTPQAFRAAELLDAHRRADAEGFLSTDTAGCLQRYCDLPVVAVPSSPENVKLTFPEDITLAESLLSDCG